MTIYTLTIINFAAVPPNNSHILFSIFYMGISEYSYLYWSFISWILKITLILERFFSSSYNINIYLFGFKETFNFFNPATIYLAVQYEVKR